MSESGEKDRVAIILHSGAYDRAAYALSIALVGLASGFEAHILLTYEGLKRFTKGHLMDVGEETSPLVRVHIQRGLESGGISPLDAQLADAKKLGLKLYACPSAMAALNITINDLTDEIDDIMGLAAFLNIARSAAINYYV
ncbi:MAG: DsrE/DsrF/DrsH-like family protein [Chloroflexi bacterium]|nr:DsrE/DsrF/DrsH-like family protein [Chloroflexota bacterium]